MAPKSTKAYDALCQVLREEPQGVALAGLLARLRGQSLGGDEIRKAFRLAVERDVIIVDRAMVATFNHHPHMEPVAA